MHQMATQHQTSREHALTDAEDLDREILHYLSSQRITREQRGPSACARAIGQERAIALEAMNRLEAEGLLDRYMGLRLTQDGYRRLANLNRRT